MKLILFALVAANLRPPAHHKHAAKAAKAHKEVPLAAEKQMSMEEALAKVGSKIPGHVLEEIQKGQQKRAELSDATWNAVVVRSGEGLEVEHTAEHKQEESGLDKATETLSQMMDGALYDKELAEFQCKAQMEELNNQLFINAGQRAQLSSDVSTSMGDKAESKEDESKALLESDSTKEAIEGLRQQCTQSMESLTEQVHVLTGDLATGKLVLGMTECKPADDAAAFFMQCGSSNGKVTYELGHDKAKDMASKIKSVAGQEALQRAAKLALGRPLGEHAYVAKGRQAHKTKAMARKKAKMLAPSEYVMLHNRRMSKAALALHWKSTPENRTAGPSAEDAAELERVTEELASAGPPDFGAQDGKCTVAGSPACPTLQDALTQMVAEVGYGLSLAEAELAAEQHRCAEQEQQFNSHLETWTGLVQKANTRFMFATASNNEHAHELGEKVDEANTVGQGLLDLQTDCMKSIQESMDLMCGISTIRIELLKMSGGEMPELQDCVVSEWEEGECSAECGGGERTSHRKVTIPAAGGAECQALSKVESCNTRPCPIDCVVGPFSNYGDCSAGCGGGVMDRGRQVVTPNEFGGEACPSLKESAECNIASCNTPCEFGDWEEWSSCSKRCGGGVQTRTRPVSVPAGETGYCPGETLGECDPAFEGGCRIEEWTCKEEKCPPALSCSSAVDLMILVDSSGSLGEEGWAATKSFTMDLIDQLEMTKVQTGLIKFSDVVTRESGLTHDKAALQAKVEAMEWSESTTETALAFEEAITALHQMARYDASSVVLIVTDGNADFIYESIQSAHNVRKVAKLVVVPVGEGVNMDVVNEMVNFGETGDAVFKVADFNGLDGAVTDLIATMCASVECSEEFPGDDPMAYRGCQTKTKSGYDCQTWAHQYPKEHIYTHVNFPNGGLGIPFESEHNFCRDPDGDSTIWCVIAGDGPWWEYCDPIEFNQPV